MLFLCITLLLGSSLLEEVSSMKLKTSQIAAVSAITTTLALTANTATPSATAGSVALSGAASMPALPGSALPLHSIPAAGLSTLPESPDIFAKFVPIPSLTAAPTTILSTTSNVVPSVAPPPPDSALPSNPPAEDSSPSTKDDPPNHSKGGRHSGQEKPTAILGAICAGLPLVVGVTAALSLAAKQPLDKIKTV